MKIAILGTTSLVAVAATPFMAMAADPIKLQLGGFWNAYMAFGKIDRDITGGSTGTGYRPETFRYEGEIWFSGETRLDNGTTIGIRVELEGWSQGGANTSRNDQLDEEYLYAFGNWGRLEFGARDAASYKSERGTPSALPGWGFHDPDFANNGSGFSSANNGGRDRGTNPGLAASNSNNSGDATKITYYTPVIAGFRVGLSYTPAFNTGGPAATCFFRGGGGPATNCPKNANAWHNGIDVSATYTGKFDAVSVDLYGGYMTAGFDRGTTLSPADSGSARYKSWAAGGRIGYEGFTFGGAVGRDNNGLKGKNATRWYSAGIMYEAGAWQMSAGWWGGRNDDGTAVVGTQNAPGKDEMDMFELGVTYLLSPGIRLVGGLTYTMGSGQSKSEKADAWALLLGTSLQF
ncbi:porin [Vineibacter terrae]|uniref:Porin n=1 Tax=Vineibacter terrae TaxID=2586908 RepID=A0A5C8PDB4_9HYPH|nr:porin [Vineibacter terrae]TXL71112.1 porin [Vineibacter terrae]